MCDPYVHSVNCLYVASYVWIHTGSVVTYLEAGAQYPDVVTCLIAGVEPSLCSNSLSLLWVCRYGLSRKQNPRGVLCFTSIFSLFVTQLFMGHRVSVLTRVVFQSMGTGRVWKLSPSIHPSTLKHLLLCWEQRATQSS